MKGLVSVLAVGGGALIATGRGLILTERDFSAFPGGSTGFGALLILCGLCLALNRS